LKQCNCTTFQVDHERSYSFRHYSSKVRSYLSNDHLQHHLESTTIIFLEKNQYYIFERGPSHCKSYGCSNWIVQSFSTDMCSNISTQTQKHYCHHHQSINEVIHESTHLIYILFLSFLYLFSNRAVPRTSLGSTRFASSAHPSKRVGEGSFKENWLSDPGAYPVIFIIAFAGCFCSGVGFKCLSSNPDVRIVPSKRNSVLRTWD